MELQGKWLEYITAESKKVYMGKLKEFVKSRREETGVFPRSADMFNAFKLTPYKRVKCVIVGQEPYCKPNSSDGLAFSSKALAMPPQLKSIYKEIRSDIFQMPNDHKTMLHYHNSLVQWAIQGVFLINTILTVENGKANSHTGKGWEKFMIGVFKLLNDHPRPLVFMLWGKHAQGVQKFIDNERHLVLTAAHPSPFTADKGFFGCDHFSRANEFMIENQPSIDDGRPGSQIGWGIWKEKEAKQLYNY